MTAVLTAADIPPPPGDGPPGQPYVSPDDLSSIPPLFEAAAQQALLPLVAQIWQESAGKVHTQLVDAAGVAALPPVSSLAAETYLAQAANTFAQVGDDLWNTARSELLAGFQAGESIPQLSDRLRNSAGLTARKATLVARTQVLDASNAGSYATAQASGLDLRKGWLDTPDMRTRPTHRQAGETYGSDAGMIPLADQFTVGGYSCDRPHDPTLPPAERYSCRCALVYSMGPAAVRSAQDEAAPQVPLPNTSGQPTPPLPPVEVTPAEAAVAKAARIGEVSGSPPITRQLAHQAELTPRAMADLDAVHIPAPGTPDGDAYLAAKNGAAHAYYTPLGSHPSVYATAEAATENPAPAIWFNPHWHGNRLGGTVRKGIDSGWYTPAPADLAPLERTLAHEYGHHVTNVLFEAPNFNGTADMAGAVAQRVLGPINDALGANRFSTFARNGDLLEPVHWGAPGDLHFSVSGDLLDEWVRQNHDLIAAKVSGYAAKNFDEFLAEVWQEYSTMGAAARPHIQTIGVLLRDVTEELRAGGGTLRTSSEVAQLAVERPLSGTELAARLRTSRKGRAAMAQTEYRYTGNLQANKDLFPDATERQEVSDAFAGYRGIGSARTNKQLREGGFVGPRVASMDKAFAKSQLKDDVLVYRGGRGLEFGSPDSWPADLTGRTWTEKAFTSTSYDPKSSRPFASDGVLMRIFAPKGTRAVGLSRESIPGGAVGEGEILLDRGMSFRVIADHGRTLPDGITLPDEPHRAAIRRIIDVEVIPEAATPIQTVAVPADLSTRTVIQLRALAKEQGITGYSKLTKPQLVERLSGAPPAPAVRLAKARPGSTIGDVELGPTALQEALGETPLIRRPVGDFVERPYDGPDGVITVGGQRLPAGFRSDLPAIRRGEFQMRPGLTADQSRALDRYALSRVADPLNTVLRKGETSNFGTATIADQIVNLDEEAALLDSAIGAGSLARDTELYRGALMRPADIGKLQVGAVTAESGYLSTTSQIENAFQIINWRKATAPPGRSKVVFRILAPKGTPAGAGHIEEREVLLARGRRLRVVEVRRPTRPGDVRSITLEILPDQVPAVVEIPLAKRRITELRTLAKQRGLTVPPRATKADLVKALEAPPKTAVEQAVEANAAKRAAARERNKLIEQRAAAEQTLAELDDLLFKKASREAFEQRIALAQLDAKDLAALRNALDDPAKLRAQVTRISKKQGITVDGKAGAKVKFDPATMDPVGEVPAPGTPMVVIRRGSTVTVDGDTILLNKAVVKLPTAPVRKAAVPKATKAPAARRPRLSAKEKAGQVQAESEQVLTTATPGTKVIGKDLSKQVDYDSLPPEYNHVTDHDDALTEIVKRQGFAGHPQVVSRAEFDAAVKRGEVRETWRGIGRHTTEMTPDQLAEAYRTGDFHVGLGINGNGTYVAIRRADGEYYGPTLLRIGLRKDARVISADDLDREMDAYFAVQHTTASHQALQRQMLAELAKAKTARARANIRRHYFRAEFYGPDSRSRLLAVQRDPGRFAALRGYDAIDIPKERSPDKHAEMIILNRTATIVQAAE